MPMPLSFGSGQPGERALFVSTFTRWKTLAGGTQPQMLVSWVIVERDGDGGRWSPRCFGAVLPFLEGDDATPLRRLNVGETERGCGAQRRHPH
jgi:hypothetical protein